jgi:hypothetical protein
MSVDKKTRQRLDKLMADCKAEAAVLIPQVEAYLEERDGLSIRVRADLEYELNQLRQFHDSVAVPSLPHDHVSARVSRFEDHKATFARLMK